MQRFSSSVLTESSKWSTEYFQKCLIQVENFAVMNDYEGFKQAD